VWALGFRPFYLLGATFVLLAIPLWLLWYLAGPDWSPVLRNALHIDLLWHMHEMVFGFALVIIIGFLFTAVRNWTGLVTPRHGHLALLAALWLAGRLAMLLAPPGPAALIDLAFVPLAAWPLYRLLRQANNRRNLFLIGLLGLLTTCNVVFHAVRLGWISVSPFAAVHAAILIIVVIESVIGARVIPMFTANGAPGSSPQVSRVRDQVALVLTVVTALAFIFGLPAGLPAPLVAGFALGTAATVLLRVLGWQPQRTSGIPLLWILHLSYGWIAVGLLFLALALLKQASISLAFHALTVGSMAGLIMGMITRTTLGHTGRALVAGRAELWMYGLIQLGALARVVAGLIHADGRDWALVVSGTAWAAAFLLYLLVYAPYLWRARVDGREG
jgi:uncharacterized protein involved in response to NO